jgi:hypothetical protein
MTRRLFAATLAFGLMGFSAAHCGAEGTASIGKSETPTFPLQYRIIDPDNPKNADKKPNEQKLPPLIVMFPGGMTVENKDATGPIGRLEAFRGKSKLLPESNDEIGLPVLLCGLRFLERRDSEEKLEGYDVELQGEFNAVRVPASKEAMESFLANKPTVFELESTLNYGIIATHSTTRLELERHGDQIYIRSVEGDFKFREGFFSYKSATLKVAPQEGRKYLFYGESAELPTLRIL